MHILLEVYHKPLNLTRSTALNFISIRMRTCFECFSTYLVSSGVVSGILSSKMGQENVN